MAGGLHLEVAAEALHRLGGLAEAREAIAERTRKFGVARFGLELLWVLEATVAAWPEGAEKLAAVVGGAVFTASELPVPTGAACKPPEMSEVGMQGTLNFSPEGG